MKSYVPNDYISTIEDTFVNKNKFSEQFESFGVYDKLKNVLNELKEKYSEDLLVLISNDIIDYKDIVDRYKTILSELSIDYIQTNFEDIDIYDIYLLFNQLNKNKDVESILDGLNQNKQFEKFSEFVYESYIFNKKYIDKKYHQYIFELISKDAYLSEKYIKEINNKHFVIIDDTLFTNNYIEDIYRCIEHLYSPKSISVITATAKIL